LTTRGSQYAAGRLSHLESTLRQRLPGRLRVVYDRLRPADRALSTAEGDLVAQRVLRRAGQLSGRQTRRLAQHWEVAMSRASEHGVPGFPPLEMALRDAQASLRNSTVRQLRQLADEALWAGEEGAIRLAGWAPWERWADRARRIAWMSEAWAERALKASLVVLVVQAGYAAVAHEPMTFDLAVQASGPLGWRIALALMFAGVVFGSVAAEVHSWLPLSPAIATRALAAAAMAALLPHRPMRHRLLAARHHLDQPWRAMLANEQLQPVSRLVSRAVAALAWFGLIMGPLGLAAVFVGADNLDPRLINVVVGAVGGGGRRSASIGPSRAYGACWRPEWPSSIASGL
jgi:hypothetical protein